MHFLPTASGSAHSLWQPWSEITLKANSPSRKEHLFHLTNSLDQFELVAHPFARPQLQAHLWSMRWEGPKSEREMGTFS